MIKYIIILIFYLLLTFLYLYNKHINTINIYIPIDSLKNQLLNFSNIKNIKNDNQLLNMPTFENIKNDNQLLNIPIENTNTDNDNQLLNISIIENINNNEQLLINEKQLNLPNQYINNENQLLIENINRNNEIHEFQSNKCCLVNKELIEDSHYLLDSKFIYKYKLKYI